MTLKSFLQGRNIEVENRLQNFQFWQKLSYGLLCTERLLPNYFYFSKKYNFGRPEFLAKVIDSAWSLISNQLHNSDIVFSSFLELASDESINPNSSLSMDANWAQDALISVYDLTRFIIEPRDEYIINVAWMNIESLQKFIFERYGYLDDSLASYTSEILGYMEMSEEIKVQNHHISEIEKMVKYTNVTSIRSLQVSKIEALALLL